MNILLIVLALVVVATVAQIAHYCWKLRSNCDRFERYARNSVDALVTHLQLCEENVQRNCPGKLQEQLQKIRDYLTRARETVAMAEGKSSRLAKAWLFKKAYDLTGRGMSATSHLAFAVRVERGSPNYTYGSPPPFSLRRELAEMLRSLEALVPWRLVIWLDMRWWIFSAIVRQYLPGFVVATVVSTVAGALIGGIFFAAHGMGALLGLVAGLCGSLLVALILLVLRR